MSIFWYIFGIIGIISISILLILLIYKLFSIPKDMYTKFKHNIVIRIFLLIQDVKRIGN